MQVLIGSQALKNHLSHFDRQPSDYDFINTSQIEGCEVLSIKEKTNEIIYNYCNNLDLPVISTPFGDSVLAPLEILKILKISSLQMNKAKHQYDLKIFLKDVMISPELSYLVPLRIEETKMRVQSQKLSMFFEEAHFPRIIDHDKIHLYINRDPMYKNILKNNSLYLGDKEKFDHLSYEEKKTLLFEELLVFGIERDLLPRIRSFPSLINQTVEAFQQCSKSTDSGLHWFFKFSKVKGVKGTPTWQSQWIQKNQSQLLKELPAYWNQAVEDLSVEFWDEVLVKCFDNRAKD